MQNLSPKSSSPARVALALAGPACIGAACIVAATPHGIGANPDSVNYIDAARNLLSTGRYESLAHGQLLPLTHFPPLYSVVLAVVASFGEGVGRAAVWSGVLLCAANIATAGLITWRATGRIAAALLVELALLLSPNIIFIHAMALSEGLFVLLMLWALFMTAQYLVHEERWRLVCAGVITGLAVLTRYVGISLAAALVLVVLPPTRWRSLKSWRNAAALAVPAAIPFGAWLIRNASHGGSTTDRSLAVHWLTNPQLKDALWTVEQWLFPPSLLPNVQIRYKFALLLALAVPAIPWIYRSLSSAFRNRAPISPESRVFLTFAACYCAFLVLSISFVDAATPLDGRILSPLYVVGTLFVVIALFRAAALRRPSAMARSAGFAIFAAIMACDLLVSWRWVRDANANGIGYSALQWRAMAGQLTSVASNASTVLFSNCPEGTYFVTGRPVLPLPVRQSDMSLQPNSHYALELKQLQSALKAGGSAVYYYHCWERSDSSLFAAVGASPVFATEDGAVYRIPDSVRLMSR